MKTILVLSILFCVIALPYLGELYNAAICGVWYQIAVVC